MHYCQRCDEPQLMTLSGQHAACPRCGHTEPVSTEPLFIITGASGSGKSTIFPLVCAELRECVVFDVDWLLDSAKALAAGQELNWPAFRDAWLSVAHGAAQTGHAVVLFGPFIPEHLQSLPARRWVPDLRFLNLDCGDEERQARLKARPSWRLRDIDDQVQFGRWLRTHIESQVKTDAGTPAQAAAEVMRWIRRGLHAR